MEIKEIKRKEVWEDFLTQCKEKTFLCSWNWGEFQEKQGNKIWRMGVYKKISNFHPRLQRGPAESGTISNFNNRSELLAVALVVKIKAKRGTFLFLPHGPVVKFPIPPAYGGAGNSQFPILEFLLKKLKETAKEEKAGFIRIAPVWEKTQENIEIFKKLGFIRAPIHMHAEITWELDTSKETEEIFSDMRKTTRYLIRQAEKNKDIEIIQSQNPDDIAEFNKIYQETVVRHHFTPFSLDYLKNQFNSFLTDNRVSLFLGKYKGEVVSAAVIVFWQEIAFYHHGASLLKYQKIPVSYLLQWEAIKEAKKRKCRVYNFWGIAEKNWKLEIACPAIGGGSLKFGKHPWYGLSLFKMGFGGHRKEYVKTQDYVLSPLYYLNYFIEKIRKIKRGL